jgi:hypothetical protein
MASFERFVCENSRCVELLTGKARSFGFGHQSAKLDLTLVDHSQITPFFLVIGCPSRSKHSVAVPSNTSIKLKQTAG